MSNQDIDMEKPDYEKVDFPAAAQGIDPQDDKRILRRIDICLLPVMALSYFFQFVDKTALGSTAVLGLRDDLNLSGQDYSWANSIYYFGYLVATGPFAMVMVRWKVGKMISGAVLLWGITLLLAFVCHNASGLLVQRFFLGFLEAPIAPGLSLIVSMWYKRSEQPLRHAGWFMGNSFAGMAGSLMAYGIGHIDTIAPWKAVFIIFGALTITWSVALYFLLPDTPTTAWFLNEVDRKKAVDRVNENMMGVKDDEFKWYQVRECLLDPKTYFLLVINFASVIPNGAEQGFTSIVISGLGFNHLNTLLLQSAKYVFQAAFVLTLTTLSSKMRNVRTYWMAFAYAVAIVGVVLVRQLPPENKWGRYSGFVILISFTANMPLILSIISGNFGGFTKKVTMNALYFVSYCVGNIIGPQTFLPKEAPGYKTGFLIMLTCFTIGLLTCLALRLYLIKANRDRDKAALGTEAEFVDGQTILNLEDKTDREISEFRYVY
ncbi:hypothetical protein VHEMI00594 [[Torrubiella] hemipterigena]|uniref:Major facilitator superfamily (MFS) profile domain-containing protein n=1 Tax=[Torrubiella] hemipterigena TaxID=1531966 RepID=A0A0A1T2D4_9HYPO|nr:hypothetical protein VHEMI00594 [[Torrubiella] hemipterigena]